MEVCAVRAPGEAAGVTAFEAGLLQPLRALRREIQNANLHDGVLRAGDRIALHHEVRAAAAEAEHGLRLDLALVDLEARDALAPRGPEVAARLVEFFLSVEVALATRDALGGALRRGDLFAGAGVGDDQLAAAYERDALAGVARDGVELGLRRARDADDAAVLGPDETVPASGIERTGARFAHR